MESQNTEKLRYPVGKFECPEVITGTHTEEWINVLEIFPGQLATLVSGLSDEQLDTPYRPGGWTVRQVVHHLYDSHTNSYVRFKWALTEDSPVIKGYYEDRWADLSDTKSGPVELSLRALETLHARWVYLLRSLSRADLEKAFVHPEKGRTITLAESIGMYAWHSCHHYAHIRKLLEREGWVV